MKKNISSLVIPLCLLLMAACKKPEPYYVQTDFTAPVISLKADTVRITLGGNYTETGFTAQDQKDGDISTRVTDDAAKVINTSKTGEYKVTYTVKDNAGNTGTAVKNVIVKIDVAGNIIGSYDVKQTKGNLQFLYTNALTLSSSTEFVFSEFGDYQDALVKADVTGLTGTNVVIPSQTLLCGMGGSRLNRTFSGKGIISDDGSSMIIDFTETTNGVDKNYTSVYTKKK